MFTDIVIALKEGLDPEPLVNAALEATSAPARLHLVTAVLVSGVEDELDRLSAIESQLDAVVAELTDKGFEVTKHVAPTPAVPGHFINSTAAEVSADLIVIGLAKKSRVGKALMGSDAQRILLGASLPVLSVPLH